MMKLIFSVPILFLVSIHVDASQFNPKIGKDAELRGRRLISFSALDKLIIEGGAETASDGSSPTLAPATSLASKMEVRTTLTPTNSPTNKPSKIPTRYPTSSPSNKPTTDAPTSSTPTDGAVSEAATTSSPTNKATTESPTTSSPTDRPTTNEPTTSSPSTSGHTTSEPTESPSADIATSTITLEPTYSPTTVPATSNPTQGVIATPTPTPTPTPSSLFKEGIPSTRTSLISLGVKGETASNQDTIDSICSATQALVNKATKRSFGERTETTLDCNVSMGQIHATAVTEFPDDTQAPNAITYDDYLHVVMISDEILTSLPSKISEASSSLGVDREVKAAVDTSVHPPVLQLSFEELHDSGVSMRPTFTFGAIMVAFFTVVIS